MEEFDVPDPDFAKGFNDGYLMARHEPELAQKIGPSLGDTKYGSGFNAGREYLELEKKTDKLPGWLKQNPKVSPDKDQDKEISDRE